MKEPAFEFIILKVLYYSVAFAVVQHFTGQFVEFFIWRKPKTLLMTWAVLTINFTLARLLY